MYRSLRKMKFSAYIKMLAKLLFYWSFSVAEAFATVQCYHSQNVAIEETTPIEGFIINGDGTLLHKKTGLMWLRCPIGQKDENNLCVGALSQFEWIEAVNLSKNEYLGYMDWRLPNLKELSSIIEAQCIYPSLNFLAFPTDKHWNYWSSTPSKRDNEKVMVISMQGGAIYESTRFFHQTNAVILVRGESN